MNIRLHPLALGMMLSAGTAILVTGCYRLESGPVNASAPATTTLGTEIDDAVVTARVNAAMLGNIEVQGFHIKVETRKGMVLLSGFVDSPARAEGAILAARAVEGVKGVNNGMTVRDGQVTVGNRMDDGIVTARVKSALLSDPSVKSIDIAVVTRKGDVQLSGYVDNQAQIKRAIDVARGVEGVQGVANEMSVKK